MPNPDLPHVVVDEQGILRFNGCTAQERLAALDEPADTTIHQGERTATGRALAARREGPWRFSMGGELRFVVGFIDDRPVSPAAGWSERDWPKPSIELHRVRREVLETILREYRRPEDIERIYPLLVPRFGSSISVVRGLMDALGVALERAKSALDAACERANCGAVSGTDSIER